MAAIKHLWLFHLMVIGPHLAIVISSCLLWALFIKPPILCMRVTPSWQNLNTIGVERRFLHRNFGETHWVCSRDSTYINFQYLATILKRRGSSCSYIYVMWEMLLHFCHVKLRLEIEYFYEIQCYFLLQLNYTYSTYPSSASLHNMYLNTLTDISI